MQTFETRSAFEVPISETHEWHSNIRMQDGGTFECIRMHIPSTCGLGLYEASELPEELWSKKRKKFSIFS